MPSCRFAQTTPRTLAARLPSVKQPPAAPSPPAPPGDNYEAPVRRFAIEPSRRHRAEASRFTCKITTIPSCRFCPLWPQPVLPRPCRASQRRPGPRRLGRGPGRSRRRGGWADSRLLGLTSPLYANPIPLLNPRLLLAYAVHAISHLRSIHSHQPQATHPHLASVHRPPRDHHRILSFNLQAHVV